MGSAALLTDRYELTMLTAALADGTADRRCVFEVFARRPQVQERMTSQIADALADVLEPRGVLVVLEAEHLCMAMRGVRKPGSTTVTSAVRGIFRENAATRSEAMSLVLGR